MSLFSLQRGAVACAFATLAMVGVDAAAATIRVTCEVRVGTRSKISVDGNNLVPGQYSTVVMSGSNTASSPLRPSFGDEIEVDYDSNTGENAIRIAPNFITGAQVTGKILDANGNTVISDTVFCRVRRR